MPRFVLLMSWLPVLAMAAVPERPSLKPMAKHPEIAVAMPAREAGAAEPGKPMAAGAHVALPAGAAKAGKWATSGKRAVWRLAMRSAGAKALRVHFMDFNVGEGAVWVHDGEFAYGPYSGKGVHGDGDFWSDVVDSERLYVEYVPAGGKKVSTVPFTMKEVSAQWDARIRGRQPQLASDSAKIGLAYGSEKGIQVRYSKDHGATFSAESTIPGTEKAMVGRHRGPRIVFQSGNTVITAVVGGDLMAWRSDDEGVTWSKPERVNDVANSAREGLHAMANGNGWVVVVWLDLRGGKTAIYGSKSSDGGRSWDHNFKIYENVGGTVCECCHPSVTLTPGGGIAVMWRNALDGSRDMYWSRSRDAGKTWSPGEKLGMDTWKLEACPMDGGAIAVSPGERTYTVWRRAEKVYVAVPGQKESLLGEGKDPALTTGLNHHAYVVWTGKNGQLLTRSTENDAVETLAVKGAYPQLVFTGLRILAAWEQDGAIVTGTLPAPSLQGLKEPQLTKREAARRPDPQ